MSGRGQGQKAKAQGAAAKSGIGTLAITVHAHVICWQHHTLAALLGPELKRVLFHFVHAGGSFRFVSFAHVHQAHSVPFAVCLACLISVGTQRFLCFAMLTQLGRTGRRQWLQQEAATFAK